MKTYIVFTDANDFEVRVDLGVSRHGGKLLASCPTERLAETVSAFFAKTELDLDVLFEVVDADEEADELEQEQDEEHLARWSLRDAGRSGSGMGESYAERSA